MSHAFYMFSATKTELTEALNLLKKHSPQAMQNYKVASEVVSHDESRLLSSQYGLPNQFNYVVKLVFGKTNKDDELGTLTLLRICLGC